MSAAGKPADGRPADGSSAEGETADEKPADGRPLAAPDGRGRSGRALTSEREQQEGRMGGDGRVIVYDDVAIDRRAML